MKPEDIDLRKPLAALLAFALLFAMPAAFMEEAAVSLMGYEEADNNRVWANHRFFERMEEATGVRFDFAQYSDLNNYLNTLKAFTVEDGNLPQVLFKAQLDPVTAQELLDKGVLVDLAPYLKDSAPNFYALMESDQAIARAISLEGGAIPALPHLAGRPGQNILWINKTWLDELKLQAPTNLEEFEQVLSAFKTRDPNRNGRNDEIPLSVLGPYEMKYLAHAWGLLTNDFNIFLEDGKVSFMPLEEGFERFVADTARWYEEGLLDRDSFTTLDSLRRVTDAKAANRFGAYFAPLPTVVVPMEWTGQYQALMPLQYEGRAVYRAAASPVFYGAFALTAACEDIPRMLSWVDRLYTREGAILAGVGVEGADYVVDGDGSWRLLREPGDRSYLSEVIIAADQSTPGISMDDFQLSYTDPVVRSLTEQTMQVAAASALPFPDLPLTQADINAIAPLQAQLGRYVDESIARFVMGEWQPTAEQFAAFRTQLEELGVQDFLALWQGILDREDGNHGL